MKKKLLFTLLALNLLNTSCASIVTGLSERNYSNREIREEQRVLQKVVFKPVFETLSENSLKIKLVQENTYLAGRKEISTSKKDIPWFWSLATLGGTAAAAFLAPIWGDKNSDLITGVAVTASLVTLADLGGSILFSAPVSQEKQLDNAEIVENEVLPFTPVAFNIGNETVKFTSDKNGEIILADSTFLTENTVLRVTSGGSINKSYRITKMDLSDNSRPKYPPKLSASVAFSEQSKTGALNALESGEITLNVTNKGRAEAKNLLVKLTLSEKITGLEFPSEIKIVRINSNEVKEIKIPVRGLGNLEDGRARFNIEVQEPFYQADADPILLSFDTRVLRKPEIVVEDIGVEDQVDNKFVLGQETNISVIVRNKGNGLAKDVTAVLSVPTKDNVQVINENDQDSLIRLGDLNPGEWKKLNFTLYAPSKYAKADIPFSLIFTEKRVNFSKEEKLSLSINKSIKPAPIPVDIVPSKEPEKVVNEVVPNLRIDVDNNIPRRNVSNPDAIAVIIGNKDYNNKDIPPVEYAIRDAKIMREYLKNSLGFKEENIFYHEGASQADFIRIFGNEKTNGELATKYIEPGKSDVFVYYSGHGAPDTNTKIAYFVPVDAKPTSISLNGYSLETFYNNLGKSGAKTITVVLDSCFSGSSEKGMIINSASPLFIDVKSDYNYSQNMNVITSASNKQISSWYDDKKHSLFSYYFFKALQLGNREDEDKINPDQNRDNALSFEEIHDYVSSKVKRYARRLHGREQTPQLITRDSKKIFSKF